MLNERRQTQKTTYCVIPFIWYILDRHIDRDKKQISGFQGLMGWGRERREEDGEQAGVYVGWWKCPEIK